MVRIRNKDLQEVYHSVIALNEITRKEIQIIRYNRRQLDKYLPMELHKTYSAKVSAADEFIGNIELLTYEQSVLSLVAAFERIIFTRYANAYGILRSYVSIYPNETIPFYKIRTRFINDRIDKLAGVLALLEGSIDNKLLSSLKDIRQLRNFIAHGKSGNRAVPQEMKLEDIVAILDRVIAHIS